MNKNDLMSDAEWEVMRVVWAQDCPTSREIISILQPKYHWAPSTVKTLLKRLVDKGFLKTTAEGRSFHYQAVISQLSLSTEMVKKSFQKLCTTKQAGVLMEVLKEIPLSFSDIEQIETILKERRLNAVDKVKCQCLKGQCECGKEKDNE